MILTQEFLKNESNKRDINLVSEKRIFNENTNLFSARKGYDLFISHSFLDKKLILTLLDMFNKSDYSVYVDWLDDPNLDRNNVTSNTASIIKNRIMQCKGLSYIATANIVNSKWCPWELGLADGLHSGKACILPILKEGNSFRGTEYIGIYPYIEYKQVSGRYYNDFWIVNQEDQYKSILLREWLNGKKFE